MPILFLVLWIILNGKLTLEVLVIGAFVVASLSLLCYKFLGFSWKDEKKLWAQLLKVIQYLCHLLIEIIKAGFGMAKIVLSPKIEIEPVLVRFKSPLRTNLGEIALANSITLTPGTITIYLEDGEFVVHSIQKDGAEDLIKSSFVQKLDAIERGVLGD